MKIRDLINDNKKETKGKSRIRDLVQSGYDSLGSKKYDEEERKEAEGDGSLSPFSTYRTANRERAEAAVTGYRQAMESEKLARQSYMQRFGVMDAEDRSDKFMDPALSAASKAERVRQNTEKARRMFGIHEDADDYAAAARKAANEATARIRTQAGEIDRAAGEIDRIYGAGTAKAMKEDLGEIGKSAWARSEFADNDKRVFDFYKSRGGLTISGKTAAERRAQETKLEQERERLVKLANQGEEVVEETPGVTIGDMYENPFPLRKGTTGENQEYIDEYGRATGRTVRERIAEIDAELNAYRMYQSAADKLVTGVAAQYEDAKKNGVKRQPTIAELDALEGLSPEEKDAAVRRMMAGGDADVDALFEMTDQDYRDYYNTVPFVAWYASKTTFGDIPGVNRSLETEGKLADNTNVNFEYLTDEEKRALIWVLHNEGGEQVNAILADMQPELDRRSVTQRAEEQRERNIKFFGGAGGTAAALAAFGTPGAVIAALPSETKGKVLTDVFNSAASVPVSVASAPLSFLDSLAQSIPDADGEVRRNPYGTYQRPRKWAETVRSDTAEDLEGLTGGGKILGMGLGDVYMAGMSAADSVVGSMAMGPAYSVIMGMGAASDEMNRLAEAGASNGQAVVGGLLAGVAETVFEHVSLEYFAKNFISGVPENWADFIKKTLVQAGVEGSEEVVTEIANTLANSQVMGTQSDWNKAVREYTDAGMSREEAYRRVWVDKAYELWKSGASGALSGGMMAGGVAGVVRNNMQRAAETRQIGADITEANKGRALSKQAIDIAASGNVDAKTAKALEKAAEAYDKKNDVKRAGKLFRAVEDAVNEGITDEEAQETAAGKVAAVLLGDGVDYVKASDPVSGDAVTVDRAAPIARTEGGSVYMNTDRGEVALEDLAFEDDAVRDMIYSVSEYGPEYANMVLTNYGGEDVGTYLGGMREGILTGQYGDLGEELYDFNNLSRADQNLALKIGQAIRADQVAAKAEAAKAARLAELNVRGRDLVRQDMKIEGVKAGRGASGRVGQLYFDQGVKVESDLDRANADFAKLVSLVYGNDIVIFDSEQNPELRNKNGMHVGSDGSIWVDIRAGEARQGLVAYALSHEMTHEAAQWAPEAYRAFTDFLVKNYAEQGVSVRQLVDKKMADMGTDNFDAAFDEVIADACERFLLDSNAIEKLDGMRKTDRTTFEKIRDFIKSAIAKLREALQSLKTAGRLEGTEASEAFRNSATGEQIEELEKKIEQLEDAWSLVLMEAAENRAKASGKTAAAENVQYSKKISAGEQAVNDMGIAIDKESESAYPDQFSLRTWNESDYQKNLSVAARELAKTLGVSESKARKYIRDVNSVAKIIAADRSRLDFEAAPGLSAFVSNVEYGGSIDFSTICKKRRLMTGTMAAIQDAIGNKALSIRDYLDIRNMMKERNYEVSCGLCYVEGSRANMGKFAEKFRELYKKYNPDAEWVPTQSDCVNPDKVEKMRVEHPEVYEEYEHFWNNHGKLREEDPNLFASQQKPKLFQADTEYNGEILDTFRKDGKVDKDAVNVKNKNGGLRIQSFSDFEIIHLLDSMQVITDMSRVGLAGQSYTKVADFARALGGTGLKINLSLIAKGVDENGQIILDEVEGMKRSDAEELRNKYSDNVGTILVAFNDEQLKAALNDPFIDFIIPFHRSQWASKYYDAMGLPKGVKDFTNKQNEKLLRQTYHEFRGRMVKDKAKNFMPNAYWDFNKSGKENAEEYLRMCAAANKKPKFDSLLVNNGDGSYSLQPDGSTDGYWKLLIDFKMYDNEGKGAPQRPVTPTFDTAEAERMLAEYEGGHDTYPVAQDVVDEFVKKNGGEGVQFSTRTGTSTSTRAVVERALKTLKDGPEKTALTAYKRVLDQIDEAIAEYSEARKNRDAAAAAEAKKQLNTLQAKARKMETAPAMQNVAALQDVAALNEDVRNLSRLLKLQSTETGGAIAMKSSLENAASDLMKEHGIRRGKAELVELLNNFYTDMTREVRAETLNREYMVAAAQPVAEWLVDNAPNSKEIDAETQKVLNEIRGAKISVNEQEREYIENKFGNFENWRKSLYPIVNVKNDSGSTSFALFWDQLTGKYPDYFDDTIKYDEALLDLEKVISDLKSRRVTEYYIGDEAYGWLRDAAANDVAEAFWRIKPYETVADKYAKEIRRLKEDHRAYRNIDEYIQDQKQAAYDLGYSRAKLQQVRAEYRRRIRSLTENMSNRLVKPKVNKYIPESLRAATAEVLKAINLDSGRSKSLSEKLGQLREQYQKIIDREKAAQGIKEDQNGRYPITTEDQVVEDTLKLVEERVKDVPISEMSSVQLEAVYTALKMFDHVVRDRVNAESMNTLLDKKMTVQDIGERLIEESEATKERRGAISRYFNWQMRPEEFFETLAGYKKNSMWHRVYQMLDNAQRQQIMYEMQGNEIFRDVLKDQKYVRSLSAHKDGDLVDIGLKDAKENPYKITRGMMLSIYKHLQNEENMRHIMIGGLVGPDLKKYYDGKTENVYNEKENRIFGVIGAELASAYKRIEKRISDLDDKWEAAKIRGDGETMDAVAAERDAAWTERDDILERGRAIMDQIRKNIEALLTEQDRAFLAASDKFFDEFSRGILNDATKKMYGFEKAKVENYFPIHVSSAFLGANFESIKRDFSVEGSGFMKDRVQSSKPIMLEDFGAVIDRQISNVAKYAALAPALKDFSKIYSVIRGGAEFETSVGKTVSERFGDQGVKYLENLIADLNGARSREASIFDKLRSRGAGAVLTLNPRVSMVQAASYVTAASELGYGPLAQALVNPKGVTGRFITADRELIKKYTGMLWTRKEKGNIDAAVAATRSLGNKRTLAESKLKFLTGWIEAVDAGTVGRLWAASEYYVQKKNPDMKGYKTSGDQKKIDQYYMKVADVFSNVIERTQPNYTVMQRPAVLRSTNAMTKALTMFMTQRLQNANILYSATRRWAKYSADYKAGINGVTREDVREARAGFVNAVTSQMISAATISAMRLVADMLLRNMKGRRDEDGEITGESVGWSLLNDFLSSAVSNFVGGSEAYEAVRTALSGGKYYGISAGGLDQINDFVSDTVNVLKNVAKGEFKPKELMAIGTDIGTLFGVPLNNAYKILKAIKGWGEAFGNETKAKGNLFDYGTGEIWESGPMERTKKQKGNIMLKAYREGNKERYREIQRQFNDTSSATARENADDALLDAVYEEWKTGAIDDREALDILEDCLAKPPKTENDERIQIGRWEVRKTNESLPAGADKETYGAMKDLRESFAAYVYPAPGTDRASTGAAAKAMIKQYREWGYDDEKIRDAIRETFKDQYVTLKPSEQREMKRYIVKLYSFTKDKNGDSYDASELIDKWKKTDAQIAAENAAEEEDEREWG